MLNEEVKMMSKLVFLLCVILNTWRLYPQPGENSIIVENFDSDSFGDWIIEGNAFGDEPAGEEDEHYMVGFLGSGFASSENEKDEPATGTLTSPPFTIERNTIHFLLGSHEIYFMPGTSEGKKDLVLQLLVDGKVVRSTWPDEYHAMFWRGWDVSEFKGQKARIRIVDKDIREGAHIDVDEIIQTDIPVEGILTERTLKINQPKLNFPVNEHYSRYYVELWVDGRQIRGVDVSLAPDEIDYWVVTDLSPWLGKEVEIRTRQYGVCNPAILDRITLAEDIIESDDLYNEPLRQQFHFSSKRGWINDPNGLVYYDGEYHLFYQHNPYGWDHSRNDYNKTWGHAVSTDLIHWKELPGAIHPDHLGPIYSGSAVVDHNNTTGFQSGDEKPIVCIYTSAGGRSPWSFGKKFTQSIAYSNDRGRTFTIYPDNPVQKNLDYINRDPRAIWHEPSGKWVIVLHFDERSMVFFTSNDLKTWEKQSEFKSPDLVDCPELFELPVDGDTQDRKWILYGGSGGYYVGTFDGRHFIPETEVLEYNFGNCFYASQTFSNVPGERRIQIAWALIPTKGMPFNMSMLFPVELTLRTTEEGLRMFAYPVSEIKDICKNEHSWADLLIKPGQNILSEIEGELFDIYVDFEVGEGSEVGFIVNGLKIAYNSVQKLLSCGEENAKLKAEDGRISLRILVDRLSVEIFANTGRVYMPVRALPNEKETGLKIYTGNGDTMIRSLFVRELNSVWQN
jgi:sucrose-6-phosphate hydrolase SacC (GH32 family)